MATHLPKICVASEIPRLFGAINERCAHLASQITSIDPKNASEKDTCTALSQAEIVVTEPHHCAKWLYSYPNIKFIQGTWAGVESVMSKVKVNQTPSFKYCRYSGCFSQSMAEYVIGYIVAQERNFKLTFEAQQSKEWCLKAVEHISCNSRSLDRLSIGILGVGDIGKRVAHVCKQFGMTVWGLVSTIPPQDARLSAVDFYREPSALDELLLNCDYICNILPSTVHTRGLLDKNKLELCKARRSVFINVGRGDICNEKTILDALNNAWLRAAILDVFSTEPLPEDSPLWTHPKVIITPHCSAVSIPELMMDLVVENIENYVNGRPLKYLVDWSRGY